MKNRLVFLFVLLISINFGFSIIITTNLNDEPQNYFSLQNPEVKLKTSINETIFYVNYAILGTNYSKNFTLNQCANMYCSQFSILDLISSQNASLITSKNFEIKVSNETKNIYLDILSPSINILNYNINNSQKKIKINFNISDDFSKVKESKIYLRQNKQEIFLADITNKTRYEYNITKMGNLTFVIKSKDFAGNIGEATFSAQIVDIFEPNIKIEGTTYKNEQYSIKFRLNDDSKLSKYEIKKGNISIVELISGTNFQKEIQIPFKGKIQFISSDSNDNTKTLDYTLPSIRVLNNEKKISNNKIYSFNANFNECFLIKLNNLAKNKQFAKNNNKFEIKLDEINSQTTYSLEFYCRDGIFTQYLTSSFTYDITSPQSVNLSVKKLEDGSIKLIWSKSTDNNGQVKYKIYKDSKLLYQTSRQEFIDRDVKYPNEYEYYIITQDLAENTNKSKVIKVVPKKISINILSNSLENVPKTTNQSKLDFFLKLDFPSNLTISIFNRKQNKKIFEKKLNNSIEFREQISLEEGENVIILLVEDEYGNRITKTYTITKEPLVIPKKTPKIEPALKILQEKPINQTKNNNLVKEQNTFSKYLWLILFILLLIALIVFIKHINVPNSKINLIKKKKLNFDRKRRDDLILSKTIEKVKQKRLSKEKEKIEELRRKKEKRNLSNLEKKKLEDLKHMQNKDINLEKKPKQNLKKSSIKKKPFIQKHINKLKNLKHKINLEAILSKKVEKEKPKDEFSEYLERVKQKNKRSWSSTKEYRQSYLDELKAKEEEKIRQKEEEERLKLKKLEEKEKDKQKKLEEKLQKQREKDEQKILEKLKKESLNEYLKKRKHKKNMFLVEKLVDLDLKSRFKKNK